MTYDTYLNKCANLSSEKVVLQCAWAAEIAEELGGAWDYNSIEFKQFNRRMSIMILGARYGNLDIQVLVDGYLRANPSYWDLPEIVNEFRTTGDVSFLKWGVTIRLVK